MAPIKITAGVSNFGNRNVYARLGVLLMTNVMFNSFWYLTPCSLVITYWK